MYTVVDQFDTVYQVKDNQVTVIKSDMPQSSTLNRVLTMQMQALSEATANIWDPDYYNAVALAKVVNGSVVESGPKPDTRSYTDGNRVIIA